MESLVSTLKSKLSSSLSKILTENNEKRLLEKFIAKINFERVLLQCA